MGLFDEETPVRRKATHTIGEDLSSLSVDELGERIALLEAEIARVTAARAAKAASRDAAAAFFRRE
ncbi:DUF1192 domain-containing protein [Prosthecomicrobium pneumaticum]|uniref:Uncharacterized small protein (DUF1192 family) n=1 Tax=Prosthecomicrobium pneumaticum TaxID=81895 RepID=A0A7W9FKK3_9HYPH|nr:DUF1192 domain-containing protein [Prosthecomicrobium pneumaticum]MBB5752635.1 uncharacterized small protein (DUF1192 family) [Prosthecomicrobium pneumaticum]